MALLIQCQFIYLAPSHIHTHILHSQEFLAYSESPVTLEDIFNITGRKIPGEPRPTQSQRSPLALSLGKSKGDGDRDSTQPNLTFLSTWDSNLSKPHLKRASIHHFCTTSLSPQLPLPVQILSRQTHARKPIPICTDDVSEVGQTDKDRDSNPSDLSILPPPNTPRSPRLIKDDVERGRVFSKQTIKKDKPSIYTPPSRQLQISSNSSSCSQTYLLRSQKKGVDDDDVVAVAQRRLQKELMRPSSVKSEVPVKTNKPTNTRPVTRSGLPVTSKTENRNEVDAVVSRKRVTEDEGLTLAGARMEVINSPSK